MEAATRMLRCFLILSTVYGIALCGDFCTDDLDNTIYCLYGCCGWDDSYCCSDTWGTGSIAGTVVGIIFFIFFIALIVVCCRRRYRPPAVIHATPGNAGIAVVTTHQTNMATGYAPPVQQPYQKPYQPYPGQYPPQYPGQPGAQQPPAYAP